MSVLDILIIPDKRLKYKSTNVEAFDEDLKSIVKNMFDTLVASGNGIGLAAPQVGINKRIVVIDLKEDGKSNPMTTKLNMNTSMKITVTVTSGEFFASSAVISSSIP